MGDLCNHLHRRHHHRHHQYRLVESKDIFVGFELGSDGVLVVGLVVCYVVKHEEFVCEFEL